MYINKLDINNLNFRPFSGGDDIISLVEGKDKDKIDINSTLEDIPTIQGFTDSLNEDNCIPEEDILVVEIGNQVIGYAKIGWWTENDGTWVFLHNEYLLPEWRDKGIENEMLLWAEDRIRNIAKQYPVKENGVFGSNASSTEESKIKLLTDSGYEEVFSVVEMDFNISNTLHDTQLPDGFMLKQVTLADLRQIWEANNSVYASRNYIQIPTEEDFKEFYNNPNNDFSLWHVAWHNNEIAAFVISEINDGLGEIVEVSTVAKYRRQGLASSLLITSLIVLQRREVHHIRLSTNGENVAGAKSLYEKIGFEHLKTYFRYRKPIK